MLIMSASMSGGKSSQTLNAGDLRGDSCGEMAWALLCDFCGEMALAAAAADSPAAAAADAAAVAAAAAAPTGRPSELTSSPLPAGSKELPQQLSLSLSPWRSMAFGTGREAAAPELTLLLLASPLLAGSNELPEQLSLSWSRPRSMVFVTSREAAGSEELPQQLSLSLSPRRSMVFATGREAAERPGEVKKCLGVLSARGGPSAATAPCGLVLLYGLTRLWTRGRERDGQKEGRQML